MEMKTLIMTTRTKYYINDNIASFSDYNNNKNEEDDGGGGAEVT